MFAELIVGRVKFVKGTELTHKRNIVIQDGSRAKLCGYDMAIIYLHCLLTGETGRWQKIAPVMVASVNDDLLNGWHFFTKTPLVPGRENPTPLYIPSGIGKHKHNGH